MSNTSFNHVVLLGNVGNPPRNFTGKWGECTTFSIATNKVFRDKNGQKRQTTTWIDCIAWGKIGTWARRWLCKGQSVLVVGVLENATWITRDGKDAKKLRVNITRCSYVGERIKGKYGNDEAHQEATEDETPPVGPDGEEERMF